MLPRDGRRKKAGSDPHPTAGSGLACAGVDGDDAVQPEAAPLVPVGRQRRQQPVRHRRRRRRARRVRVVVVQDPARPRPVGIAAAAGGRRGQRGEERRRRRRRSGARGRPRAGPGAAGEGVGGGEFFEPGEPRGAVREARHGRPEHRHLAGRERHHFLRARRRRRERAGSGGQLRETSAKTKKKGCRVAHLQGPRQVRGPDQPQVVRRRRLLAAVAVADGDLADFAGGGPRPRHGRELGLQSPAGPRGRTRPAVLPAAPPPPASASPPGGEASAGPAGNQRLVARREP